MSLYLRFLSLFLLLPFGRTAEKQTACGAIGKAVSLNPEYQGDLGNSETLWIFTNSKKSVNILDYFPNEPIEHPNEQFKSRLAYNASNGCLLVDNLKLEDQGNFTFRVNGQDVRTIELTVTEPVKTSISCTPRSTVSFPGIERCFANVLLWGKNSENMKNVTRGNIVLQFPTGSSEPSIAPNYKGRISSVGSNASFILHNLTSGDEGVYQLSINQPETIAQIFHLRIIDDLSNNSIRTSSSTAGSTIQLSCEIAGCSYQYRWQKDGKEIPQHHQLVNENRNLIILSASKNDCGTYTCIAKTPEGTVQEKYTLTVYGISWEDSIIIGASIIGLVLSLLSHGGFLILLRKTSDRAFQNLFIYSILSLVATIIALIFWISIKDAVFPAVVALCTLSYWILIKGAVIVILKGSRPLVNLDAIVVIPILIPILKEEIQQSNQGCYTRNLTWSITVSVFLCCAIICFTCLAVCLNTKENASNMKCIERGQQDNETCGCLNSTEISQIPAS